MIEFIEPLYVQQVTTVHKSLSDTLSFSSDCTLQLNYSDFHLNFVVLLYTPPILLAVPSYNSSARTPQKAPFSVVKNACLLVRYLGMGVLLLKEYASECVYRDVV
jgi:hypothetical protein